MEFILSAQDQELIDKLEDLGADTQKVLKRLEGDMTVYKDCLKLFITDLNMQKLIESMDNKDYENAIKAVHTLKGMALNVALLPLSDAAIDMLEALRAGEYDEAEDLLPEVKESYDECCAVIREELDN